MNVMDMVRQFATACRLPVRHQPELPSEAETALWLRVVEEEAVELKDAVDARDLPWMAHELADVVYAAYGMAAAHGVDLDAVLAELHRANMTRAGRDGPVLRADGKVLPGPTYVPPDIAAVLERLMVSDPAPNDLPAPGEPCGRRWDSHECAELVQEPSDSHVHRCCCGATECTATTEETR